jgi:hypothetical protein
VVINREEDGERACAWFVRLILRVDGGRLGRSWNRTKGDLIRC